MLEEIEGDPSVFIHGDDLAVYKGARWEPFTRTGDIRELLCEKVFSPGPERHAGRIPSSKTAVAVELDFVEPFLAFGQLVDQSRIHRLDERDFCEGRPSWLHPGGVHAIRNLNEETGETSQYQRKG